MSNRLLSALLVVQSLVLLVLCADRFVPTAHAQSGGPVTCEVQNWPDALKGSGFATLKVDVKTIDGLVPVVVRDWDTSDEVKVVVSDWATSDDVRVRVVDWDTSDVVTVRQ
ncbi:MAG: hypothetical protein H6737_14220 [Alphaproteobacteria bacterium]|nr:hypothetical protein [Alphaproteobacteria bacterium]